MPRKPPQTYNVCRAGDGALVVIGVPLDMARSESARLNAEARVIVRQHPAVVIDGVVTFPAYTEYAGMFMGNVTRYEVRTHDGLVIS